MQSLRGLLANVVKAIQAAPQVCNDEEAVKELLWDYLAQQLLQTASK